MISVEKILDQIPQDSSIEIKKLEKILKLTKKADRINLEIALKALFKLGIILECDKGMVTLSEDNSLIKARLRCSSKGYCFAIRDDNEDDIYIRDNNLNHAWNEDRVLVRISRIGLRRRSPEGIVQCILNRRSENLLGLINQEDDEIIAKPLDDRVLTTIKLPTSDKEYLTNNDSRNLVEVQIDRYPLAQLHAEGHVVRHLPIENNLSSDREIILTKTNLQKIHPTPRIGLKTPNVKNRVDLTNQKCLIFQGWKSLNAPQMPAIYSEPFNGGTKLWVHVPAIAERCPLNNKLDLWLRQRSVALCLGDTWRPLLNESLTKAALFAPKVISEAISICLDIDKDGSIYNWEFSLSKIKPFAIISNKHLEAISKRKPRSRVIPVTLKPIKDCLDVISNIVHTVKALNEDEIRLKLIKLDLPIPNIEELGDLRMIDPSCKLQSWTLPLRVNDAQSIIEVILRSVNRISYKHFKALKLPGIQISTDFIDANSLNDVVKSALALDVKIELNEEGVPSLPNLLKAFAVAPCQRVLEKMLKHTLPEPKVQLIHDNDINDDINDDINNNELPLCNPTSNYISLINQHILVNLLIDGKDSQSPRSKEKVNLGLKDSWKDITWPIFNKALEDTIFSNINASLLQQICDIQRQSSSLKTGLISIAQAHQAEMLIGSEIEAVISGVQSYGFFAELPPFMSEGLVHVSSLNDDWYEYRSRQNLLIGRKFKKTYQLGDTIHVKVTKVDVLRNQIDLEVVDNNEQIDDNKHLDQQIGQQVST